MIQGYGHQYYTQNKDYWVNYAIKNKEKLKHYASEKFTCDVCGGSYNRKHIKQHDATFKHQKAIKGLKD
tara:strand:- start:3309 stop:3515 length:207 start_codon:yes stop_codon:yes gene_type:complete